jgi:group I intron endonuclease
MNKIIKGVYCLTNKINQKRYVGIGMGKRGIKRRWEDYLRLDCKGQTKLYNALKLYGVDNFTFEVILETDDIEKAKRVEIQMIALWNLTNSKYGYNISIGGDYSRLGLKSSEEHKKNNSLAQQNRSEDAKEQTKQKLRDANLGKKHSEETKEKQSLAKLGKKLKPLSQETREKLSELRSFPRKIQDTVTGQFYQGTLRQLAIELKLKFESFKSGMNSKGKYKQYILIKDHSNDTLCPKRRPSKIYKLFE